MIQHPLDFINPPSPQEPESMDVCIYRILEGIARIEGMLMMSASKDTQQYPLGAPIPIPSELNIL